MELDEPARVFEGKAAQEEIVDQTKDRGVEPNPEGQREDGEKGEARRFEQLSQRKAKIGQHTTPKVEMRQ